MRRKLKSVPNAKSRALVYTCAILALSVYALPRIPSLQPGLAGTYSTVWILFAALALASNLYFLVGADKERSQMLESRAMYEGRNELDSRAAGVHRRAH